MEYRARDAIPLHLRSSFHDEQGTLITASAPGSGFSCLSSMKDGASVLVSAIGRGLTRAHAAAALTAAGPGAAAEGRSAVAVTLRLPAAEAEAALKRLHRAFFGGRGAAVRR